MSAAILVSCSASAWSLFTRVASSVFCRDSVSTRTTFQIVNPVMRTAARPIAMWMARSL
jgi:hypothetical protein